MCHKHVHAKGGNNLEDSTSQSTRSAATAPVGSIYNFPNTCSTAEGTIAANHRSGSDGNSYCQGQPPLLKARKEESGTGWRSFQPVIPLVGGGGSMRSRSFRAGGR